MDKVDKVDPVDKVDKVDKPDKLDEVDKVDKVDPVDKSSKICQKLTSKNLHISRCLGGSKTPSARNFRRFLGQMTPFLSDFCLLDFQKIFKSQEI